MALDPAISLQVRPPQFNVQIPQPLEQFGQVLSLQGLMQEQGLRAIQQQQAQLQLQQLRTEMQERQDYATWLRERLSPSTTSPGAMITSPIAPIRPALPGGTVTVPATTAPLGASTGGGQISTGFDLSGAPAITAPAPSLGTMMTTPPAAPAAPAPVSAAPIAPVPAPAPVATGGIGGMGDFNIGEVLRRFPNIGPGVAKNYLDTLKSQLEVEKAQHENNAKTADRLGSIAVSIRDSPDPAGAFAPAIYQAIEDKVLPYDVGRQLITDGYERHKNDVQRFIDQAQDVTKHSETAKNDAESLQKAMANASTLMRDVQNPQDYATKVYPNLDRRVQAMLGPTWTPQLGSVVQNWNVPGAELPKTQMAQREAVSSVLAAKLAQSPQAFADELNSGKYDPDTVALFTGAKSPLEVRQRSLNPEKYTEDVRQNRQQLLDAERVRIDRGKFELDQQKNNALYGPGTAESWAATVYQNPDAAGEVPTDVRSKTQQIFQQKYGLAWPRPLQGAEKQQEGAARSTLADAQWIRNAMQNPNIANNVGAILGNLQNVEQATGVASGLTGADAQMAQEFRTRMRAMIANEAGAMRSRGVPSNIINDLVQSSPRINMDEKMLRGALDGVEGTTRNKLDQFEQSRFGAGKMRPPEARGLQSPTPSAAQQKALSDLPHDGKIHQLSDGSVWQVNTDGRITAAQAPSQ